MPGVDLKLFYSKLKQAERDGVITSLERKAIKAIAHTGLFIAAEAAFSDILRRTRWGVWNGLKREWQFGIDEPTKRKAGKKLFEKIGKDAYKWRFEVKALRRVDEVMTPSQQTANVTRTRVKEDDK